MRMLRKKIIVLFILVQLFVVISITSIGESDNWPMFSHDVERTGFSTSNAPTNTLRWTDSFGDDLISSPVIVDGKLYFTSDNGTCYCKYASNGTEIWRYEIEGNHLSSPVVSDGSVYVGSDSINIHCLNAENGSLKWYFQTDSAVYSPPIVTNNYVYVVASFSGTIYCLNKADGSKEWNYSIDGYVWAPGAFANNKLYIATTENKLYCIDTDDRSEEWIYQINGSGTGIRISPAVSNGQIYFGADDNTFYCLNAETGEDLWNFTTNDKIWCNPSIANNKVYFGSNDDKLYCFDANGNEQWSFIAEDDIQSSPSITETNIYFGSNDNYLYCLDLEEGNEQWKEDLGADIVSSPAIADGFLYVTAGSQIFCFGENNPPETPEQPTGETEGYVNEEYSYSVTQVTDPDDHDVFYKWDWGDETTSEWLSSSTKSHAWEDEGTYEVKAKVRDHYEGETEWSTPLTVTISPPLPQLLISCQASVIENETFDVNVASDGSPVENVNIEFDGETKSTDESGTATFTAPEVTEHTKYTITATLEGYLEDTAEITVLNEREQIGFLYGFVSDNFGTSLDDVKMILTGADKNWITFTEDGIYTLSAPPGTYTLTAQKEGYVSDEKEVEVVTGLAQEFGFVLGESQEPVTPENINEQFIDAFLNTQIKNEKVGGKIDVGTENIEIYNDRIDIEIQPKTQGEIVSFIVDGDEELSGKVFVVEISDTIKDITVKLDDTKIGETKDLTTFFSKDNPNAEYLRISVSENYVLVHVPSFSTHTITITSVATAISIIVIGLYILFCLVIAFVVGSPVLFGPHHTYFKKKRGK